MKVWGDMVNPTLGQSYMDFKVEVYKHYSKARSITERYFKGLSIHYV